MRTACGRMTSRMRSRYERLSASAASRWPRGMASTQPRQIWPRKALLLRTRATPAATHGLMSKPSTGAPKKMRNSCSSSGVPWNSWMNAAEALRSQGMSLVRLRATTRPPIAPPMNAISESASVQRAASRMNTKSFGPNVRIRRLLSPVGVVERAPVDSAEQGRERERQCEVDRRHDDVDLEDAEGLRLQVGGDRREVVGRDHRSDARAQHEEDELARQRRIDRLQRGLQDDVAEDLVRLQVEREASFDLTPRDRLDAGTDDLGRVGAEVDDHRRQRRRVRRPAQADCRQREEEEEQLDQERRVADELDVGVDEPAERRRPTGLRPRTNDRHREAAEHGQERELDRLPGALEQERPGREHRPELERVVHSLPCWRRIRADEARRAQVLADFRSAFFAASTFAAFCICLSAREGLFPLVALASFGGLAGFGAFGAFGGLASFTGLTALGLGSSA